MFTAERLLCIVAIIAAIAVCAVQAAEMGRIGVQIKAETDGTIVVQNVERWGAAGKAGVKQGDVLLKVNDTPAQGLTIDQVAALTRGPAGSTVTLAVSRNGTPLALVVTRSEMNPGKLGFHWEYGMDDELPRITFVEKGGSAGKAGIKAGDYIVRVEDFDCRKPSPGTLTDLLGPPVGMEISLSVLRIGAKDTLSFKLLSVQRDEIDHWNAQAWDLHHQNKHEEAAKYTRMAAEKGDARAQYAVAHMYLRGLDGVSKDQKEGMKWLKKAADQDYVPAFGKLGIILCASGEGKQPDCKEAARWFQKGADLGDSYCHFKMGMFYKEGRGVKQDLNKSLEHHRMAAERGSAYSMNELGLFYMAGTVVKRDSQEAMRWFRKAWEKGLDLGAMNVGLIYKRGVDAPVDYAEAAKWFRLAAEKGNQYAKEELDKLPQVIFLSNEIQPAELRQGEKLQITSIVDVKGIEANATAPVTLERQLIFQDKPLFRAPKTETQDLANGRHTVRFEFTIPSSAAAGSYKFVTTLRAMGTDTAKETLFVIR